MEKASFASGLLAGAVAVIGVSFAIPGLLPGTKPQEKTRAAHTAPVPPKPQAKPLAKPTTDEIAEHARDDVEKEIEARGPAAQEERPSLLAEARLRANETAAIATLRNLVSAQAQFQASAAADENQNGVGEYGSLGEMSGSVGIREGEFLNPPVLSTTFRHVIDGRVERSGYYFRVFLPRSGDSAPISELPGGGFRAGAVDARTAETTWCMYAWPTDKGVSGKRTFFTNQMGDILSTTGGDYSGERGPAATAAFAQESSGITGDPALDKRGQDNQVWNVFR